MAAGLEVYDSSGRLQVSSNMTTYVLVDHGSGVTTNQRLGNTTRSSMFVPIGGNIADRFVAIQIKNGAAGLYSIGTWNGTLHAIYASSSPVGTAFNYFVFQRATNLASQGTGLEVRNSSNQITFSSGVRPMNAIGILDYAALSHGWGLWYANPASLSRSGRQLAFAQCAAGGHRTAGMISCWDGGRQEIEAGNNCNDRRYDNNGKIYGCSVSSDGATVSATQISFDDVTVSLAPGQNPPADVVQPMKAFVIDVTNITGGGTYVPPNTSKSASISGANESYQYAANNKYFVQRTITANGGTPTGYNWTLSGSGGTWSFHTGGDGYDYCTPRVTGVANGATATATLKCVVTFSDGQTATTETESLSYKNTTVVAGPAVSMQDDYATSTTNIAIRLLTNGTFAIDTNSGPGFAKQWLTSGSASDVEVRATKDGIFNMTNGNTWLALSSNRTFVVDANFGQNASGNVNLTFRDKNTLATLDTASIYVNINQGGGPIEL